MDETETYDIVDYDPMAHGPEQLLTLAQAIVVCQGHSEAQGRILAAMDIILRAMTASSMLVAWAGQDH